MYALPARDTLIIGKHPPLPAQRELRTGGGGGRGRTVPSGYLNESATWEGKTDEQDQNEKRGSKRRNSALCL